MTKSLEDLRRALQEPPLPRLTMEEQLKWAAYDIEAFGRTMQNALGSTGITVARINDAFKLIRK